MVQLAFFTLLIKSEDIVGVYFGVEVLYFVNVDLFEILKFVIFDF